MVPDFEGAQAGQSQNFWGSKALMIMICRDWWKPSTGRRSLPLGKCGGRYPDILEDDDVKGEAARELFGDAQKLLKQLVEEKSLKAQAVIGLWPANSVGDDIEVYEDDSRTKGHCDLA